LYVVFSIVKELKRYDQQRLVLVYPIASLL
jgi:hypothetical protein